MFTLRQTGIISNVVEHRSIEQFQITRERFNELNSIAAKNMVRLISAASKEAGVAVTKTLDVLLEQAEEVSKSEWEQDTREIVYRDFVNKLFPIAKESMNFLTQQSKVDSVLYAIQDIEFASVNEMLCVYEMLRQQYDRSKENAKEKLSDAARESMILAKDLLSQSLAIANMSKEEALQHDYVAQQIKRVMELRHDRMNG
jgi:hypothetical protein